MSNKESTMILSLMNYSVTVVKPIISSVLLLFKPKHIDQGNDCCLYKNNKIKKLKEKLKELEEQIKSSNIDYHYLDKELQISRKRHALVYKELQKRRNSEEIDNRLKERDQKHKRQKLS